VVVNVVAEWEVLEAGAGIPDCSCASSWANRSSSRLSSGTWGTDGEIGDFFDFLLNIVKGKQWTWRKLRADPDSFAWTTTTFFEGGGSTSWQTFTRKEHASGFQTKNKVGYPLKFRPSKRVPKTAKRSLLLTNGAR